MITGYSRQSEVLASLNVVQALLVTLRRKGMLSEQEIDELLSEVSASMDKSPLAEAHGAAHVVNEMKEEALSH